MVKRNKLVKGLIVGAAIGAVACLLLAPKPGKESWQIVGFRAGEIRHKAAGYLDGARSRRKNREVQPDLVGPYEWRTAS